MPAGAARGLRASLVAGALLAAGHAGAQTTAGVRHSLSFPELHLQYVQVVSEFPVSGGETDVFLPVWTPGSYVVVNHDAGLQVLTATDGGGQELPVEKLDKDRWRVRTGSAESLKLVYRAHEATLDVSESWVSPDFVLLNASTCLLYTAESRDRPQALSVDVPVVLGHAYSSLPAAGSPNSWRARDYDELVDNPLVLTPSKPMHFEVGGQGYALLNVGDDSLWSRERMLDDVRGVVRETNRLWSDLPFERDYWIFNLLVEARGGLEHDHNTVLMTSRWQMRNREDYVKWLGLVAHEYLHAWNVRRMRPAALARYDYRSEQHSRALWLAEGITNYYDDLLLSRAGLVTPTEYFERLAGHVHALELTPGRLQQSLERASFDAWTHRYQPGPNTVNETISYYVKGAVVGFVLDTQIRAETNGRRNLDHVMRAMWEQWRSQPYPDDAFAAAVEQVAGPAVRTWLEPLIVTVAEPDVDAALDYYGLELVRAPEQVAGGQPGQPAPAGFGINWTEEGEALVVASVVHGRSAAQAGILPGDELVAINDERITRATVDDRKARLRPGERVEFLVARHGRMLRIPVTLGESRPAMYEIRPTVDTYKDRRLRRLESWLGQRVQPQ